MPGLHGIEWRSSEHRSSDRSNAGQVLTYQTSWLTPCILLPQVVSRLRLAMSGMVQIDLSATGSGCCR